MLQLPDISFAALLPVVIVLVTAIVATVAGFYTPRNNVAMLGIAGMLLSLVSLFSLWGQNLSSFEGALKVTNVAIGFAAVILIGAILSQLVSLDHAGRSRLNFPEYDIILLYAVTGTLLIAFSGDLIVLLIGVEVMSLAVYVLATFQDSRRSEEAGMKYFLLGSVASAVLIYGIALVFGATGTFNFSAIAQSIQSGTAQTSLLVMGALMLLIGFGFKVGLAPFHQWTPDVYSGSPTMVTLFMSIVVKTAAFAGIVLVFVQALPQAKGWVLPAEVLLGMTLLLANMAALRQSEMKRLLAYSAIAHSGYLGLAMLAKPELGQPAMIFYLLGYTLVNAGAFALIAMLQKDDRGLLVSDLKGLYHRQPVYAVAMAIFLLSLAGLPPFAGFVGKLYLFVAAFNSGFVGLTLIAAVGSVIAFVYYLRPAVLMFMANPEHKPETTPSPAFPYSRFTVIVGAVLTLLLGLYPNLVLGILQASNLLQAAK